MSYKIHKTRSVNYEHQQYSSSYTEGLGLLENLKQNS